MQETLSIPESIVQIAADPKRRGAFFQIEANNKGLALVDAKAGTLKIYALIDPEDNRILDTRFFTYGGPLLTALADVFCEEIVGKSIEEMLTISLENMFSKLGISDDNDAFKIIAELPPKLSEDYPEKKNVALAAIAAMGSAKLRAHTAQGRTEADDEWNALSNDEKLAKIEDALNDNVRDMLAGDGGGLDVIGLKNGKTVLIRYQGACASCGAAGGGTLYFIEDRLQQHVYYDLRVEPEFTIL